MERIEMNVTMQVTVPQALALQAMFKHWNRLASWGSSRMVAFYVDGDGNFKPKCEWKYSSQVPELTEELEKLSLVSNDEHGKIEFDFDPIAGRLRDAK